MHINDFVIWNKELAWSYPQLYKTLCLITFLKHSITGPHLEPKKCSPRIAKLIQNTFQYHSYTNVCDFQKVSSLETCNSNFRRYMAQNYDSRKLLSVISQLIFGGNKCLKTWDASKHTHTQSLTSSSFLTGGKDIAFGISYYVSMASSTLILTSAFPSTSHYTRVTTETSFTFHNSNAFL